MQVEEIIIIGKEKWEERDNGKGEQQWKESTEKINKRRKGEEKPKRIKDTNVEEWKNLKEMKK